MSVILTDNHKNIIEQIKTTINQSSDIVLTTHKNPDGDAIGSVLGIYYLLKGLGKNVEIIINDELPYNFEFLPESDNIKQYNELLDETILNADLIIVVDLNDIERTKSLANIMKKSNAKKVMIDHHIDPKDFADIYLGDTESTSTGELLYYVVKSFGDSFLSKEVSTAIYTAIMTDSGSFRFPRTDDKTFKILSELIAKGADPVSIYDNVYNKRPVRFMKLLGEAYKSIDTYFDNKVCFMSLTKESFENTGASDSDVEDIVEQSMTIENIRIGVLLSESLENNDIRCSFRSKGDISVRDLASKFNGGGHKNAAGARFYSENIYQAKENILKEIENSKIFEIQMLG